MNRGNSYKKNKRPVTRSTAPKISIPFFKYEDPEKQRNLKIKNKKSLKININSAFHSMNATQSDLPQNHHENVKPLQETNRVIRVRNKENGSFESDLEKDNSESFKMDYNDYSLFLKNHKKQLKLNKKNTQIKKINEISNISIPKSKINIRKLSSSVISHKIEVIETDFTMHSSRSRLNSLHSLQTTFGCQDH
jgi:hypothetical protein